jgi:hypothetical protein
VLRSGSALTCPEGKLRVQPFLHCAEPSRVRVRADRVNESEIGGELARERERGGRGGGGGRGCVERGRGLGTAQIST